jgi:hypothetical protein
LSAEELTRNFQRHSGVWGSLRCLVEVCKAAWCVDRSHLTLRFALDAFHFKGKLQSSLANSHPKL